MKTSAKVLRRIIMLLLLVVAMACSKDETPTITDPVDTDADGIVDANDNCPNEVGPASNNGCPETLLNGLAEVVASGDAFPDFPANITSSDIGMPKDTIQNFERKESAGGEIVKQRWVCTEKEVDITGGTHTFPLYNTNASVIWPGNLLQGKTLDNATPSDIVVKRAGGTITYNLVTGNPVATDSVAVIDQGTVQQAMNNIIAQNGDITPANFTLDVVAVNSSEQLALEMGLKASTLTTKVSSDFSLNTSKETSSVLVKLTQQYYTMSYVKPTSLEEVFDPGVTPNQLATFIQPDNPATFISSVTYGRIFYMLYESTASAEDMKAALTTSYNAVAGKAEGSVDIESLREYNNLSVKVIAYGGDSMGTLNSVGATFGGDDAVDNLQDIVGRLAESSDIAGGLPLSYVVNSLEDPSQVVSTNLATRYTVKNCELRGVLPPQVYLELVDHFDDGIGAATQVSLSNVIVFNKAGNKYSWFNAESGDISQIFDIKDENGPLGIIAMDAVGAGVHFDDDEIYLFDDTGLEAQILAYDSGLYGNDEVPSSFIGTYQVDRSDNDLIFSVDAIFGDTSNFAFLGKGFEAACRFHISTTNSPPVPIMHFFGKPGDEYADYRPVGNGVWRNAVDSNDWNGANNQPYFDEIGAAFRTQSSGAANTRQLFFNKEGNEFIIWNPDMAAGSEFDGPWVIN